MSNGRRKNQFSKEMFDSLAKTGLSYRMAPCEWVVVWELSELYQRECRSIDTILHYAIDVEIYESIKDKIRNIQVLEFPSMALSIIELQENHSVGIEETKIPISDLIDSSKGRFNHFYCSILKENTLFHTATVRWCRDTILSVLDSRNLIERLKNNYSNQTPIPFLPEIPLVKTLAQKWKFRYIHCDHFCYHSSYRVFKYVKITGRTAQPKFELHLWIYDNEESLNFHQYATNQSHRKGFISVQQNEKLIGIREFENNQEVHNDLKAFLEELRNLLDSLSIDLSHIAGRPEMNKEFKLRIVEDFIMSGGLF